MLIPTKLHYIFIFPTSFITVRKFKKINVQLYKRSKLLWCLLLKKSFKTEHFYVFDIYLSHSFKSFAAEYIRLLLFLRIFGSAKISAHFCSAKVNKLFLCKYVSHLCYYHVFQFYDDLWHCNKYVSNSRSLF